MSNAESNRINWAAIVFIAIIVTIGVAYAFEIHQETELQREIISTCKSADNIDACVEDLTSITLDK